MKLYWKFIIALFCISSTVTARLPADLPGAELYDTTYLNFLLERVRTLQEAEDIRKGVETTPEETPWYEEVARTWAAPPLAEQIAADTTPILHGMGALFVPRMSDINSIEPNITVFDDNDEVSVITTTGRKQNLLPGEYTVWIGSAGPYDIYRKVTIHEGLITPLIPDWSILKVEVINANAKPIKGEYDIARLNPIVPIGRGWGRDIDLAEELRVWILPPGNYKILAGGTSYNSLTNFLTVRLDRGEFQTLTVVQDQNGNIIGGGVITDHEELYSDRPWRHNLNIGGSVDLNLLNDNRNDTTTSSLAFSLLLYDRSVYTRNKTEINSLIKFDLTLNLIETKKDNYVLQNNQDEFRLNSIYTYRLFPRFGPYGRLDFTSSVLTKTTYRPTGDQSHYFIIYPELDDTISDNSKYVVDSISNGIEILPLFAPITIQSGVGGNLQVLQNRFANVRFLSGFGLSYERRWDEIKILSSDSIFVDSSSFLFQDFMDDKSHTNLLPMPDMDLFELGPEVILNSNISLGRYVSQYNEFRIFFPIDRFSRPDVSVSNLLSLRLFGGLMLDYDYTFTLTQPKEDDLKRDESRHRLLLRYSISR